MRRKCTKKDLTLTSLDPDIFEGGEDRRSDWTDRCGFLPRVTQSGRFFANRSHRFIHYGRSPPFVSWRQKKEVTMNLLLRRAFLIVVFLLLVLAGCATPYQRKGFRGGFEDAHIRDNIYYVSVETNGFTSPVKAAQYFHRRAKELCEEMEYHDYRITGERDTSTASVTVSGGSGGTILHPGFAGYVECINKKK